MTMLNFLRKITVAGVVAISAASGIAAADPSGAYSVSGYLADGNTYSGTVTVSLTGEVYRVVWIVDGREITGVALGGAFDQGNLTVGPAHPEDLMLSIGFVDGELRGTATMFLQTNETYEGYLAREGDLRTLREVWTPIARE